MSSNSFLPSDKLTPYRECPTTNPLRRCLANLLQSSNDLDERLDLIEEAVLQIIQECCRTNSFLRMCHFPALDNFSTITDGSGDFTDGSQIQYHLAYLGVQQNNASEPWIPLTAGPISSPVFQAGSAGSGGVFTEVFPGTNLTCQYLSFVNTALSSVGSFYGFSASTTMSPLAPNGNADVVVATNSPIFIHNYVFVMLRDTFHANVPPNPPGNATRVIYSYSLNGDVVQGPFPGGPPPPPLAAAGAATWTVGDNFGQAAPTGLPIPLYAQTTLTPADSGFWSAFNVDDGGGDQALASNYIQQAAAGDVSFADSCSSTVQDTNPALQITFDRGLNVEGLSAEGTLLGEDNSGAEVKVRTVARSLKPPRGKRPDNATPFPPNVKYPLETAEDVKTNKLLYGRLQEIKAKLEEATKLKNIEIYLFGSQRKGKSRSGNPDIDIRVHHEGFSDRVKNVHLSRILYETARSFPYQVDCMIGKSTLRAL